MKAPKQLPSVEAAKTALAGFWGTRGDEGMADVVNALRQLTSEQLGVLKHWIPSGNPGSSTASKCDKARRIVEDLMREKG